METHYTDFLIIGAGIGGLMAAYRLKERKPDLKITVIDKGNKIQNRICPSAENGISCQHCKVCAITSGFAGAGAFSDGKYNLGTAYGGTLAEDLGEESAMAYINEANEILNQYITDDMQIVTYGSNAELKRKCLQNNLQLLDMNVRHFGTDNNVKIMQRLIDDLAKRGVDLISGMRADYVIKDNIAGGYLVGCNRSANNGEVIMQFETNNIIFATGRGGADFIQSICDKFDFDSESNAVDIGVRVEMKNEIWEEFSSQIYEPKILYRTKTFEDRTRMFCFNRGGIVSAENNDGVITANGHAFADPAKQTENCNFAILSSIKFTKPFNDPTTYAKNFSRMANLIGNRNVLVQRFGDLIRGRRSNADRIAQNSVKPTLTATAGDLSLVLPHRILTNIIETIYALDKVAPGTANDDTLLYGLESKYYSLKPAVMGDNYRLYSKSGKLENMYIVGDGSGVSRGLSQAAAMGLNVGDKVDL